MESLEPDRKVKKTEMGNGAATYNTSYKEEWAQRLVNFFQQSIFYVKRGFPIAFMVACHRNNMVERGFPLAFMVACHRNNMVKRGFPLSFLVACHRNNMVYNN